ncbi:MAG: UPF0179 family protein [Thermoplasmatota archaeon]
MGNITLVPGYMAVEGTEFRYLGEAPECSECPVRTVCHGLDAGKIYRVVNPRTKEHECKVHIGGKVVAVQYEEAPLRIAVPKKKAVEGAIITLDQSVCDIRWCDFANLCSREYIPSGKKARIVEVHDRIACLKDEILIDVTVELEK